MFLMKPRIIIADDSQTIQKVIKITLASEDFELVECLTDDSLLGLVQENNPSLVLLDFNLSENKTGYDLAKEIKAICQPKIMMLYGTFDTIDETLLEETGVNSHIVKPFDGNKFINSCRQLISDSELETSGDSDELEEMEEFEEFEEIQVEPEIEEEFNDETDSGISSQMDDLIEVEEDIIDDSVEMEVEEIQAEELEEISSPGLDLDSGNDEISIDEEWVVNQPSTFEEEAELPEEIVTKEELNTLEAGMQEWGIDVPGVIGATASTPSLPPIIGVEPQIMTTTSIGSDDLITDEAVSDGFPGKIAEEEHISEEVDQEEVDQEEVDQEEVGQEKVLDEAVEVEIEEQEEFEEVSFDEQGPEPENLVPEDDDLEYPDSLKIIEEVSKEETFSSLTPISDLADEVEFSADEPTSGIDLNDTLGTNTEEEVKALEEQIADEVDEEKNLWSTDEVVEKSKIDIAVERAKASQEVEEAQRAQVEPQIQISEEDIRARVEELIGPMVERIVREKIDNVIEKVSWEVIPDLAENIIKRELKQVTEEILQDN
jgi:DNA-binding response OmpR family regulator